MPGSDRPVHTTDACGDGVGHSGGAHH